MADWFKYGEEAHYLTPVPSRLLSPKGIYVWKKKILEISRLFSPPLIATNFEIVNQKGAKEGVECLSYHGCEAHLTHHLLQMAMIDRTGILINNVSGPLHNCLAGRWERKGTAGKLTLPLRNEKRDEEIRKAATEFYELSKRTITREKSLTEFFEPSAYYYHFMTLRAAKDQYRVQDKEVEEIVEAYVRKLITNKRSVARAIDMLEETRLESMNYHLDLRMMPYLTFYGLLALSLRSTLQYVTVDRYYAVLRDCIRQITPSYESGKLDRDSVCDAIFAMMAERFKQNGLASPSFVNLNEYLRRLANDFGRFQKWGELQGLNNGFVDMCVDVFSAAVSSKPSSWLKVIEALQRHIGFIVLWNDGEHIRRVLRTGDKGFFFFELLRWNLHFQAACEPLLICPLKDCENLKGARCSECAGQFSSRTARGLCEECNVVSLIHKYYPYFLEIRPAPSGPKLLRYTQ